MTDTKTKPKRQYFLARIPEFKEGVKTGKVVVWHGRKGSRTGRTYVVVAGSDGFFHVGWCEALATRTEKRLHLGRPYVKGMVNSGNKPLTCLGKVYFEHTHQVSESLSKADREIFAYQRAKFSEAKTLNPDFDLKKRKGCYFSCKLHTLPFGHTAIKWTLEWLIEQAGKAQDTVSIRKLSEVPSAILNA